MLHRIPDHDRVVLRRIQEAVRFVRVSLPDTTPEGS